MRIIIYICGISIVAAKIVDEVVRDLFLQSQYLKLSSSSNGWANSQVSQIGERVFRLRIEAKENKSYSASSNLVLTINGPLAQLDRAIAF